jgi:hypothetical protein
MGMEQMTRTLDIQKLNLGYDVYASDFNLYSDRRLKSNIIPLSKNIDKVKNLTPYSYEKRGKQEIGIIAQDLEKVHPESVKEDSDGYKQISTMALQTINLGALKELIEKVDGKQKWQLVVYKDYRIFFYNHHLHRL